MTCRLLSACCSTHAALRFKCDSEWNKRRVARMGKGGEFEQVESRTLRGPLVLRIRSGRIVTADILAGVSSGHSDGTCSCACVPACSHALPAFPRLIQRYTRSIVIVFALYTAAAAWFVNPAFIHSGTTYRVLPLSSSVPVFPLISVSAPMWSRHGLADFAGCAGV